MSSPFSKSFLNKRSGLFMSEKQESTFGPSGTNPNSKIYEGIKATDEAKESPAAMHGKVQDKIDKARKKFERKGEEGDFYEMNQDLYTELSKAKKSHSDKSGKDPEQESAERDESMSREMNEPSPNQKKKCSKRSYK